MDYNVVGLPTGVPLGEVFARTIDKQQPDIFGTPKDDDDDIDRGEGGIFAPVVQQRPMMSEPETTAPVTSTPAVDLNRVAYRLMADGGAVIDDEPRQAYGLGSIVKKATRAVKKVAKSDLGKIALLYAGTAGLGAYRSWWSKEPFSSILECLHLLQLQVIYPGAAGFK